MKVIVNRQKSAETELSSALVERLIRQREATLRRILKKRSLIKESKTTRTDIQRLRHQIEVKQYSVLVEQLNKSYKKARIDLESEVIIEFVSECQKIYGLNDKQAELLREGFFDSMQDLAGRVGGSLNTGLKYLLNKGKIQKFLQKHDIQIGAEPKDYEQTQKIFKKILKKKSAKHMKKLHKSILKAVRKQEKKKGSYRDDQTTFPFNKHKEVFLSGALDIATAYDTIKKEHDEGDYDTEMANAVIANLRLLVQKYIMDLQREKGGVYATFGGDKTTAKSFGDEGEEEAPEEDEDDEGEEEEEYRGGPTQFEEALSLDEKLKKKDKKLLKKLRSNKSETAERMKSLKAPAVIAGVGAALGVGGLLAGSDWVQEAVKNIVNGIKGVSITKVPQYMNLQIPKIVKTAAKNAASAGTSVSSMPLPPVPKGKGLGVLGYWDMVSNKLGWGIDLRVPKGQMIPAENLVKVIDKLGGGSTGVKNLLLVVDKSDPQYVPGAEKLLNQLYNQYSLAPGAQGPTMSGSNKALAAVTKLFNPGVGSGGGGGVGGLNNISKNMLTVNPGSVANASIPLPSASKIAYTTKFVIKKILIGQTVKKSVGAAGAAAASLLGATAPVLAGLGLGAVAAGATVAALRSRGAKGGSRVGLMDALLQSLKDLRPRPEKEEEDDDTRVDPEKPDDQDQDDADTRVDPTIPDKMKDVRDKMRPDYDVATRAPDGKPNPMAGMAPQGGVQTVDPADLVGDDVDKKGKKKPTSNQKPSQGYFQKEGLENKTLEDAFAKRNEQLFKKLMKEWITNS